MFVTAVKRPLIAMKNRVAIGLGDRFINQRCYKDNHPDVATSLNNLAALYREEGRYSEAEPLYVRSLSIREQQLGADHPDTAGSLFNMAALYYNMECYSQALPLIQRAVKIYEQALNPDHPTTQSAHSWLRTISEAVDSVS